MGQRSNRYQGKVGQRSIWCRRARWVIGRLDLTTFFFTWSRITSNLPENYLSRSKTTS